MATQPISDELLQQAIDAWRRNNQSVAKAADVVGGFFGWLEEA